MFSFIFDVFYNAVDPHIVYSLDWMLMNAQVHVSMPFLDIVFPWVDGRFLFFVRNFSLSWYSVCICAGA